MSTILFHPQLQLAEAAHIAEEQGGRLVWSHGRLRLIDAIEHTDRALDAAQQGDLDAALQHIRAARHQVELVMPSGVETEPVGGAPCVA